MSPPDRPPDSDAGRLLAGLVAARVLEAERAEAVYADFRSESPTDLSSPALIDFLTQQRLLTPYQAERVLTGDADKLVIGPYLLLEAVSGDTWGTVYTALSLPDRTRYAVRVLPSRQNWVLRRAEEQLAVLAAAPPNPAVVPLAAVGSAGSDQYLAWPFVDGETLDHSVRRVGPLGPADAARVFADLADGLAACHAAGVTHGRVQPATILLGLDRRPRLLDLGLGAVAAENASDTASDPFDYTAPETAFEPAARTPAADVYSLGCSLYFALTGLPPACGSAEDPVPVRTRNPNVPAALADLLDRMMRKSPAERPTDLRQLGRDLRAAVSVSAAPSVVVDSSLDGSDGEGQRVFAIQKRSEWVDHTGAIDFDDLGPPRSVGVEELPSLPALDMDLAPPTEPLAVAATEVELPVPPQVQPIRLSESVRLEKKPEPPPPVVTPDSRLRNIPAPVNIQGGPPAGKSGVVRPPVVVPDPPLFARKPVRTARSMLFWKKPVDAVQLSVFGPPQIAPGQRVQFLVYAHLPEAFAGVSTLCRALHADTDLLGTGYIDRPVARGTELGLHLALANAGVAKSLITCPWTGQTLPRTFEVFVQWESPTGLSSGMLSAGVESDRAGVVPLHFVVLPRSS